MTLPRTPAGSGPPLSPEVEKLRADASERLRAYLGAGKRVVASSSFQTHSIPMLHLMAQVDASIPVCFLDTGFHFPETLVYRDAVAAALGLNVRNLSSAIPKSQQRTTSGLLLFTSDPDYCCSLNKTLPMEPVLAENDVWITGVRRDQSATRANFSVETPGPFGTVRFHPMLDWTKRDIWNYIRHFDLPRHPLGELGYESVGCAPCTRAPSLDGDQRDGRWAGMAKSECGLHTELVGGSS